MIDLQLNILGNIKTSDPFVIKLTNEKNHGDERIATFEKKEKNVTVFCSQGTFKFQLQTDDTIDEDICIVFPKTKIIVRFIRNNSSSNTILLTEQCDQACIMCSQPPKNKIYDYYNLYEEALLMAEQNSIIGISGGEPTLEKENLFPFLQDILDKRPDIKFHILSNCQHFSPDDINFIRTYNTSILWGIPLYSHNPVIHDQIVGKKGAFNKLLDGFNILFKAGAAIEIRTVVMRQNYKDFPLLAEFIGKHLSLCEIWAIMQLENIGYARMNWKHIFVDTSINFSCIANALNISKVNNINALLYNFPSCTIPQEWRHDAQQSISDWKNKYLDVCNDCMIKSECCGFFNWYNEEEGFSNIGC